MEEVKNRALNTSKNAIDNDEFYTQYEDVERELSHYIPQLKGRSVYCNCDCPFKSAFVLYLVRNFNVIGLSRLTATCRMPGNGYYYSVSCVPEDISARTDEEIRTWIREETYYLTSDGSFQSDECLGILDDHDIVITNPPFSLFREWYDEVSQRGKKFLVLCNLNTCITKKIATDLIEYRIWLGYDIFNRAYNFILPDGTLKHIGSACWLTNLDVREKPFIPLVDTPATDYPYYDGHEDVIRVSRCAKIPDYNGIMSVPITFLFRHNRRQFKIVGYIDHGNDNNYDVFAPKINGRKQYKHLLIQRIS